jgi:hypothetical protein
MVVSEGISIIFAQIEDKCLFPIIKGYKSVGHSHEFGWTYMYCGM